jgi:hypothetical protein
MTASLPLLSLLKLVGLRHKNEGMRDTHGKD